MPIPGTHHYIELAFEASASLHELYIALLIGEGIEYFQEEDNVCSSKKTGCFNIVGRFRLNGER